MGGSGGLGQLPTIMRGAEIEFGTERYDPARIEIGHAAVITELNRRYVDGLGDTCHLIDVAQIIRKIAIIGDTPQIALEVAVIDRIEAGQGRKQAQIGLGEAVVNKVALMAELLLDLVQSPKQPAEARFVSLLALGKT